MKLEAINHLFREHIQKLSPYQSAREEFVADGRKMILLDANENPYETKVNRYPDPLQKELKSAIAEWRNVLPEQIFLGNGSDEIISQLIIACCEPGKDHIIINPPTFGMYAVAASIFGVAVEEVPLHLDTFRLDVDAILNRSNEHSKIIFIPTPNNPTANRFDKADLKAILEGFKGFVVIDEAYAEFSTDASLISWLKEYPHLIVLQTFSKAQGLAGVRLGMAFAQSTVIQVLNRIKAPYNINTLTLQKVLERLKEQETVKRQVEQLLVEKKRLIEAIQPIRFVETIFPSDANFFLIRVDDSQKRYNQFIEMGIVVRNPSKQLGCANSLRISVGTPLENDTLIKAFNQLEKSEK